MSNPLEDEARPTVVGTDPDMNIGDDDPAAHEREAEADDDQPDRDERLTTS